MTGCAGCFLLHQAKLCSAPAVHPPSSAAAHCLAPCCLWGPAVTCDARPSHAPCLPTLQWGAVERRPRRYDWAGYKQLFALVRALGLKLQVGIVAMCVLATIQSGAVSQLFALVRAPGLTHAAWCLPELAAALLARAMLIARSPVHASASVAIPSGGHEVPRVPQCLSSCTKQSCFFLFLSMPGGHELPRVRRQRGRQRADPAAAVGAAGALSSCCLLMSASLIMLLVRLPCFV